MMDRGVPDRLRVGLLTAVVVANFFVGSAGGSMIDAKLSSDAAVNGYISLVGGIVLMITMFAPMVVLLVIQSNINRYWASVDSRLMKSARFGNGEVECIVLGVLAWFVVVAGVIGL